MDKLKRGIITIAVALFALVTFCACGKTNLEKYGDRISELRENLFAAENAEYKITAISGKREDPYELDGISRGKCAFTVVTVTPSAFSAAEHYRYRAEINGNVYEGDLLPHPFAQSLSADIPESATDDFTITVTGASEQTFEMKNIVGGELISAEKAFTIALDKMKNELKKFGSKRKPECEIYVRLMENPIDGSGGFFWYVAFVGQDKTTVAVLLRGDTGAVGAVRV